MNSIIFISNINKPKKNRENQELQISNLIKLPVETCISLGFKCYVGIDAKNAQIYNSNNVEYYEQKIYRNPFNLLEVLIGYYNVCKVIEKNNIDIVFCTSPLGGFIGRLVGRKYKLKTIYQVHGFHFYKGAPLFNWLVYFNIENYLSKYTDELITINKEDYNFAKDKMHFNNVDYIPGIGIDVEKIESINVNKNNKRNELKIPLDSFMIVSAGYLNDNKNHSLVLKSLHLLNNKKMHYVIAGEGKNKDKLINLVKKYGLQDNVHLLGFRNDIIEIYKSSDLFILPSLREGLPVSLMEACSCKIPVLASNIRGNNDIVINGSLFKSNDYYDLAKKINVIFCKKSIDFVDQNFKNINKFKKNVINKKMESLIVDYLS